MKNAAAALALIFILSAAYAINIDFQIKPQKLEYTDAESVIFDANVVNNDTFSSSNNTKIILNVGDKNFSESIGDVEPQETKKARLEIGQLKADTYMAETYATYDFLGIEDKTQTKYVSFKVVPATPIVMQTYQAVIKDVIIPEKTNVGEEFTIQTKIYSVAEQIEIEYIFGDQQISKTIDQKGEQTIEQALKTENGGLIPLSINLYVTKDGAKLLEYSRTLTLAIANPSKFTKLAPIELKVSHEDVQTELNKAPPNLIESIGCFAVGGCKGDVAGPKIIDISVSTNNEQTKLEFTADDSETGDSKISKCYFDIGEGWNEIQQNFTASVEKVSAQIPTIAGKRVINIQCLDEFGNAGTAAYGAEGNFDVLLVTSGAKLRKVAGLEGAISQYIQVLQKEGLTAKYLELDSDEIQNYGVTKVDVSNWQAVKEALQRLISKLNVKYVVILGGTDVIPMPLAQTNEEIPSIPVADDRYVDLDDDGIPDISVARIPTPIGDNAQIIKTALENAVQVHLEGGLNFSNAGLSADTCLFSPPACYGKGDTDMLSVAIVGVACDQSKDCNPAPTYCLDPNCSDRDKYPAILTKYDILQINAHGSGEDFAALAADGKYYALLSGRDLYNIDLKNKPLVSTIACHGAQIDCEGLSCTNKNGTAFSFLANGAVAYVGNTRYGMGGFTATYLSSFYANLKNGGTLGQAHLQMKKQALRQAGTDFAKAVAYEIQLYGDPTIKLKG